MFKILFDSFLRACIRFWDNRFLRNDSNSFYEIEIARLHQQVNLLQGKLIDYAFPVKLSEPIAEDWAELPIGRPIETIMQKRARLEKESLIEWNNQLKQEQEKRASRVQSTEELEKSLGVK